MTRRNLRAVEQGNPGHRAKADLDSRVVAAAARPDEPDWSVPFPDGRDEVACARQRACASAEWTAVVDSLDALRLLSGGLDFRVLMDYAVVVARLDEAERLVSEQGFTIMGGSGCRVRNPNLVSAAQYRKDLHKLIGELGLSPHARAGLRRNDAQEDDDAWADAR